MNIWDSVHRGLEKATQEAARISKIRRLRSTIDGVSREITAQNAALLQQTMDTFVAGQLTQSELLPICQALVNLHQQLRQAEDELKQIQASQSTQAGGTITEYPVPSPNEAGGYTLPSESGELNPTVYAPPPPGGDSSASCPPTTVASGDAYPPTIYAPPPPPPSASPLLSAEEPPTISQMRTMSMDVAATSTSQANTMVCSACQAPLGPQDAFCPQCGAPVQSAGSQHLPTTYAPVSIHDSSDQQGTVRAETAEAPVDKGKPS
ncbi:MAG: zinc ribbon domain-containing protein [Ktedonobacteraceae bacterium]|nr:zinc ribbon domain-containing protein [Ktedonobacteraceae bacterium]